jgi:hypothetical protein
VRCKVVFICLEDGNAVMRKKQLDPSTTVNSLKSDSSVNRFTSWLLSASESVEEGVEAWRSCVGACTYASMQGCLSLCVVYIC